MTILTRRLCAAAGLALGAALPAAAQDLCGGVGANGQWIGGSEGASDVSTAGSHMEQMALVLMRNEYVALFSVSSPTDVRVEAQGRGGGDPVIDLRNAAGDIILSDDDSGGDTASRAETTLEPGTYCLSMKSYDGSPMTGFVRVGRTEQEALTPGTGAPPVTVDPQPVDPEPTDPEPTDPQPTDPQPTDPGGTTAQAPGEICDLSRVSNYFGGGGAVDGSLAAGVSVTAPVSEVAYWGFSLGSPQALTLTAENPDADPVITLYDGSGSELGYNDDYDGLNSRIDVTQPLAAGDYCVAVTALSDEYQPITLTLSGFDPQAAQNDLYARGEAAPPLDGSYPVTMLGTLETRLRQDVQNGSDTEWFAFDVTEGGLVVVEAVAAGQGDPVLVLYDDFGRMVTQNDDYGQGLDSLVAARVLPGTYLVGVRQFDEGTALTRLVLERYVPAQ